MLLTILKFPHPILRTKTDLITEFDEDLHTALDAMKLTMIANRGIGLAANQVGITKRFFIMQDNRGNIVEFINPEILESEGSQYLNEGCLSGPGAIVQIPRAKQVTVRAKDRNGEEFTVVCFDLEAVCVQHEIDHLNGDFFIDKAPRQQRKASYKILRLKD